MYGRVFVKTLAGHEEIQARRVKLAPRVRSLLVMVDGKRDMGSLLETLAPVGVKTEDFGQLQAAGLIAEPIPAVQEVARGDESVLFASVNVAAPDDPERMLALYKVCNEVIRTHFGLRGLSYQLQLERASSVEHYVVLGSSLYAALKRLPDIGIASDFKARIRPLLLGEKTLVAEKAR